MLSTLEGRSRDKALRFQVGVVDVVPKLIVRRLLEPALDVNGRDLSEFLMPSSESRLALELVLAVMVNDVNTIAAALGFSRQALNQLATLLPPETQDVALNGALYCPTTLFPLCRISSLPYAHQSQSSTALG
ncbi:MAG: hypothetical protein H6715_03730 [Myxococcales bacterium]|nr:hypothetical protein [Myxococcales bacterium]MCB9707164.1 hypothetical protein [Myxococcales bacterium]